MAADKILRQECGFSPSQSLPMDLMIKWKQALNCIEICVKSEAVNREESIKKAIQILKQETGIPGHAVVGDAISVNFHQVVTALIKIENTINSKNKWLPASESKKIKMFIISFNRLSCLKRQIDFLSKNNALDLHIIDNGSTYAPLLEYLKTVKCNVTYIGSNQGHTVIWKNNLSQLYCTNEPYIVTDNDIIPDKVNFHELLLEGLNQYPEINKIGLGLHTNNLPDSELSEKIKEHETRMQEYGKPLIDVYFENMPVDTTLAIYRAGYHHYSVWGTHSNSFAGKCLALRTTYPNKATHLSWYLTEEEINSAEHQYYFNCIKKDFTHWSQEQKPTKPKQYITFITQSKEKLKITFLGNFRVDYSSESHHAITLSNMGHEVIKLQETEAHADTILESCLNSDLFIWIHTHEWDTPGRSMREILSILKEKNIPSVTYHLDLWLGLNRQKDMNKDDYWHIEHFFTVDKLMADWLNKNTQVKGHYLQAAVFEPECYKLESKQENDIIFVGSKGYHSEWKYRPMLIEWLKTNYSNNFKHFGGDGLGIKRGNDLNQLYADTKIVIGDTLCLNYDYPYYWSDRVYETIGRGGFIIHPYIKGMEEHFTHMKHLIYYDYNDFAGLNHAINYYIYSPEKREAIRQQGFEHVKQNHTYTNRWKHILKTIGL